ncbi:hypothetical protein UCDDS831_g04388 [Diplodia seriata]|uniref:Uncharacterized protein n=1 Tax=Diplodia seriata TaxID=420778 RepID=A0A0G2EEY8_9PEZI|nr:hypothetical protein UCDDS831_g04388 [Diplodia seriata]
MHQPDHLHHIYLDVDINFVRDSHRDVHHHATTNTESTEAPGTASNANRFGSFSEESSSTAAPPPSTTSTSTSVVVATTTTSTSAEAQPTYEAPPPPPYAKRDVQQQQQQNLLHNAQFTAFNALSDPTAWKTRTENDSLIFAVPQPASGSSGSGGSSSSGSGGVNVISQEPGAVLELSQTIAAAAIQQGAEYAAHVSASQADSGRAACEIKVFVGSRAVVEAVPGEKEATFSGGWTPGVMEDVAHEGTPLTVRVGPCRGVDGVVSIKGLRFERKRSKQAAEELKKV